MFYLIEDNEIKQVKRSDWEQSRDGICVFDSKEWSEELKLREEFSLNQDRDNIHFCKLESHSTYLFGTFHIPVKKEHFNHNTFAFYILEGKIIFIEDDTMIEKMLDKIGSRIPRSGYRLERFLYDFLMAVIEDDILYLSEVEREIANIEENVLRGETDHFNHKMLKIKKDISRLYCYYSQLTDVGEVLCENSKEFFGEEDIAAYQIFSERAQRLQQEAQVLREYAMQVQDVYQSEIGIRQNDIMRVLTIVTTIFLPLTLIAGWYGMNFHNMPELGSQYGYPIVAGVSILVVIVCLWLFKKNKFF